MSKNSKFKKKKKVDQKTFLWFELTQSKILQFSNEKRIEEIILSYNILIEFYVMINKFRLIWYLNVSKS